jgi:hypothetical protein
MFIFFVNQPLGKKKNHFSYKLRRMILLVSRKEFGKNGVMIEVYLVSLLYPSKNEVAFKIIIGLVIDHY